MQARAWFMRLAGLAAALMIPACGSRGGGGILGGGGPAAPVAPTGLSLMWGNQQVDLAWDPVPGADRYFVYRSANCAGPFVRVATVTNPGYTDTSLSNGQTYYYKISAENGGGEGPLCSERRGVPGVPPAAPLMLTAIPGTNRVDLSWSAVGGATGYRIERGTASGGPYPRALTFGPATTAFSSTGLAAGTTYSFVVRALSGSVAGPPSTEASATPSAPPPPPAAPAFNQARGFSGSVRTVLAAADGSGDAFVGGNFWSYGGTPVTNLVRLNANGTIDTMFPSPPSSTVMNLAHATDGSGDLYVASLGGASRYNADGSKDTGFNPAATGQIYDVAATTDGSGDVYVCGMLDFPNSRMVRLNANGTRDSSFVERYAIPAVLYKMLLVPDGSGDVYAGGILGFLRRFDPDGWLDSSFAPPPISPISSVQAITAAGSGCDDVYVGTTMTGLFRMDRNGWKDPGLDSPLEALGSNVYAISPANDGTGDLYVGGSFAVGGSRGLVRIRSDGSLNPDFLASFDIAVFALALAPDGSGDLYAGGAFTACNGTGSDNLARLHADGALAPGTPEGSGFGGGVDVIAPAIDGSEDVYVGGGFLYHNGAATNRLERLNSNGVVDPAFVDAVQYVYAAVPVPDASADVYVGGEFIGSPSQGVHRLNANGTVDPFFAAGTGFNNIPLTLALALDGTGDLYVGGRFTTVNGSAATRIVRLRPSGAIETSFAPGAGFNAEVTRIVPATDGSGDVYVAGSFTSYNGTPVTTIVRLNSDGTLDAGFATGSGFNGAPRAMAIAADGSGDIYVGGAFTFYQGTAANRIIRLNADGTVDPVFAGGAGISSSASTVHALAAAADGSGDVYVGGEFSQYQSTAIFNLLRLNADGSIDVGFDVGPGCDQPVVVISPLADGSGRIYVGGGFRSCRSTTVDFLARLRADGTVE